MSLFSLCFVLSVAIPGMISLGEIVSGKILNFTLTSVLARRKQLPHAFIRLVLLKMGIYISDLVIGAATAFIVISAVTTSRGAGVPVGKIAFIFFVYPVTMFARKFKSIVRFERSMGHRRRQSRENLKA